MLCSDAITFSAIQSAFMSGMYVFISRGASVFGVFWKIILTPSTSNSSIGLFDVTVGSNKTDRSGRNGLSETLTDITMRACGQQQAVLVE